VAQSTVRLIVDAQNAIAPLKRVNDATKNLNKNTNQLKNRLNEGKRSLDRFGNSANKSSKGVNNLLGTIRKLAAAFAVFQVGKFVIFQTAELERQRKSLEVLTGSVAKTNTIIAELKAFGAVTPFKASELIETTKRLKAFGFETDKLVDNTKRIADIAGATGADLDGIATAFGQIQAKGKLQQEENLQLLERGVDITTELKNITGLQGDAFADAMRKGKIGADLVNQALINLTNEGGAFFGGASAQSTTLAGKFSTLQDGIETLAQNVGEKLEPALKSALDIAIALVNRINQAIVSGTITDVDKKGFKRQAEGIVREQAGFMPGGPFGTGQISVDFAGQTFEGQPAGVTSQITNALINAEVAKRLKEQLEVQKQLEKSTEKITEKNKENKLAVENTAFSFTEGLVPSTGFFNDNLDLSSAFLNDINFETLKISDSFKLIKSDADLLNEKFAEIGNTLAVGVSDALVGAILHTKSLGEAAKGILNDIASQLLRLGINTILGSVFGGPFASLPGFANGGRPPVGKPSVVGERGPELFVPSTAGTIIPNHSLGGGVTNNIVVNVDASGSNVEGNEQQSRELGLVLSTAIQAQLIQEKRPGGLLA
jgi:tape measure domain-containing protein